MIERFDGVFDALRHKREKRQNFELLFEVGPIIIFSSIYQVMACYTDSSGDPFLDNATLFAPPAESENGMKY